MVAAATPSDGSSSARSGSSSARGKEGRLPSMQLVRVYNEKVSGGDTTGIDSAGGVDGSGGKGDSGSDSWTVAVASPMPVLQGFCLAVIGLTTEMVGASVTLVDRSAPAAEEVAAVGFLGFDMVRHGGWLDVEARVGGDVGPAKTDVRLRCSPKLVLVAMFYGKLLY